MAKVIAIVKFNSCVRLLSGRRGLWREVSYYGIESRKGLLEARMVRQLIVKSEWIRGHEGHYPDNKMIISNEKLPDGILFVETKKQKPFEIIDEA